MEPSFKRHQQQTRLAPEGEAWEGGAETQARVTISSASAAMQTLEAATVNLGGGDQRFQQTKYQTPEENSMIKKLFKISVTGKGEAIETMAKTKIQA